MHENTFCFQYTHNVWCASFLDCMIYYTVPCFLILFDYIAQHTSVHLTKRKLLTSEIAWSRYWSENSSLTLTCFIFCL